MQRLKVYENIILYCDRGNTSLLAAREMDIFPVEINSAPLVELIRVPGIGVKSARQIISIRKKMPFSNKEQLRKLGVVVDRAEPYIKISGEYQTTFDF